MTPLATEPTSVTIADLQASTPELLSQVKDSGRPLTVAGGWVILDAAEYERLRDRDDRLDTLSGVLQGMRQIDAGQGRPLDEAMERIRQKHFGGGV